ncbi:MAG: ATP-binding protein [Alphaproteobacteria bacterium]
MTDLPPEYERLLHHIEGAKLTAKAGSPPDRTLNLIVSGQKQSGKTTNIVAFAEELIQRKLINGDPVYFDCLEAGFGAQLCVRLNEEFGRAKGSILIIDNADKLQDEPLALQTMLDLYEDTGCMLALVGEREGMDKICDLYPAVANHFPTVINPEIAAERAAALSTREAMDELAALPESVNVRKPLQLKVPGEKKP